MRKTILFLVLALFVAAFVSCGGSDSSTPAKTGTKPNPKVSLVGTGSSAAAKSVAAKAAAGTDVTAEVEGIWCRSLVVAANMYRPGATSQSSNWDGGSYKDWSSYYFVTNNPNSRNILLKQGDIADVTQYQDSSLINAEGYTAFSDEFYNTEEYFQMDIIEANFKDVSILHKEDGNYHLYGSVSNGWRGGINSNDYGIGVMGAEFMSGLRDPLYKYVTEGYALPLPTSITDPGYEAWLSLRSGASITPESIGWPTTELDGTSRDSINQYRICMKDAGFNIMFVNKNLLGSERTTGTVVSAARAGITDEDGNVTYDITWIATGDLTPAEMEFLGPVFGDTNKDRINDAGREYTPTIIIPYDPIKIKMANGVDGTNVYTNPRISITFDFSNVLTQKNIDYYKANGTLAKEWGHVAETDIATINGSSTQILLSQHDANGNYMLPFNLKIGFTEQPAAE